MSSLELHLEWNETTISVVDAALRKDTGAHYTPRVLCDFTVEQALSKRLSFVPTSKDILSMRVCDPSMGTGAFLASACRYLARRLVNSWKRESHPNVHRKDREALARKQVAKQCLYGVDVNPKAVQLAQ